MDLHRSGPLVAVALLLAGCLGPPGPGQPPAPPPPAPPPTGDVPADVPRDPRFALERVADGLARPVWAASVPGSGAILLVEQEGLVKVWEQGAVRAEPFLDLRSFVSSEGERGLLSLALDPDFGAKPFAYVHYTDTRGDTVIARYRVDPAALRAEPASAKVLLRVDQPYANHNGGLVMFGPDGFLYAGLGDGGSGGDPQGNGQRTDTLLGKLLRIDVRGDPYGIPPGNPFASGGGRPEIWAFGLRNPWRFSFDRLTGDLWIADVGQNALEEVNFQAASSAGGENYGWNVWEGSRRYRQGDTSTPTVFPVAEYDHRGGHCSVTGGYVYRGSAIPGLRGVYLYGDYCSGQVWGVSSEGGAWVERELQKLDMRISSFAEMSDGELLVVDHGGAAHRLVPPG